MGVYIPDMEMPKTGVYEISIDNTNHRDKTVMTVYKRKDDGSIHVFGSYELVPVPEPHGRLIDADALLNHITKKVKYGIRKLVSSDDIEMAPTIIPATKEK